MTVTAPTPMLITLTDPEGEKLTYATAGLDRALVAECYYLGRYGEISRDYWIYLPELADDRPAHQLPAEWLMESLLRAFLGGRGCEHLGTGLPRVHPGYEWLIALVGEIEMHEDDDASARLLFKVDRWNAESDPCPLPLNCGWSHLCSSQGGSWADRPTQSSDEEDDMDGDMSSICDRINERVNSYGNERDWAKMRPDEIAGIATNEVRRELDELRGRWRAELSLRTDKAGPNSVAAAFAAGVLRGLDELQKRLTDDETIDPPEWNPDVIPDAPEYPAPEGRDVEALRAWIKTIATEAAREVLADPAAHDIWPDA